MKIINLLGQCEFAIEMNIIFIILEFHPNASLPLARTIVAIYEINFKIELN
jgi:hypothetical protein